MGLILGELFTQGLQPVELTDTDVIAWNGTPADWQLRIHRWVEQHQHLPRLGECCWLRDPAAALAAMPVNARVDQVITDRASYRNAVELDLRYIDDRPVTVQSIFRSAATVLRWLTVPGNEPDKPRAWHDVVHVVDLMLNEFFDHCVVVGDTEDEPPEPEPADALFVPWPYVSELAPWPGTRVDWLERIHRWADEHRRYPGQDEIGVLYLPGKE
ncbi:hypothetical protein KIH27_01805 [Mycobacterium sp. M1]|uniref:Uncharacterized protein n=1 Tax=Mycolicibacter acidiphilus TaxID=2835306 RepID=A0ABS5RDR4_9MYCO|nr:hypothetical protein [Mycolicibacter acidiphilus]MBS9532319.1 hypothetical protein [Mycolicibacter acidiphilus]